ncbi:MAG TPA: fumarylacetoacetate hydrolase family protein [Candidatus Acidoferrales bacterium]|nr:fumarylacetoacetate hydrolase family protein [Candidatus Acidoferrales bacterium]
MKLGTVRINGQPRSVFVIEERFFDIGRVRDLFVREQGQDLPLVGNEPVKRLIEGGAPFLEALKRLEGFAGENLSGPLQPALRECGVLLDACEIAPPIADAGKIWCMGANYYNHRREMAERQKRHVESKITLQGFIKAPSSLTGARAPIFYPPESRHVDHEIEVAFVIGLKGRRISESEAMKHVYGYMLFNDVSARDIRDLDNGRMDRGKGFDSFGVCGPWILTADEVKDPADIHLRLEVNGRVRQDGSTRDLLFPIPYQVAWLSTAMTLFPGDIISTGTPEGSGKIEPGDHLEGWSPNTALGRLVNDVVPEPL